MIILYLFTGLLGSLATMAALSPLGWAMALLWAPLGAISLTLIVAALVAWTEAARSPAGALA